MQPNIFDAICVVIVALVICSILYYTLKKIVAEQLSKGQFSIPVTVYGQDMLENRGFTECNLVHTRLGTSNVFFDTDQWLSDPANVQIATNWITMEILEAQTQLNSRGHEIAGLAFIDKDSGPTGLISLQHLLSSQTDMKTCVVRLRRWPFLPQAAVKGEPPAKNSKWILISDVATTAGHIQKAAKVLNYSHWGAETPFAIVLLNRGGDAVIQNLEDSNINLISNKDIEERFRKRENAVQQKIINQAQAA